MDSLLGWVAEYGYPALFLLLMVGIVGLPVPDETLLTFAGYLVSQRQLAFPPTFIAAFLGSACGITLSYCLGRGLGGSVMKRVSRVLATDPAALDHVQAWFARRGKYMLLVGYFVPGVRHVTALVAGASRMPLAPFALYAYTGALLWSLSFLALGYVLGEGWAQTSATVHRMLGLWGGALAAFLFVFYLVRRRYSRSGR